MFFHDMAKFFDTIDIPLLCDKANELEFPVLDCLLTLHQHLAPRIIQCEGFCSEPILITRSILAGCKHSVALTRFPLAPPKVYVDDTAQLTAGTAKAAMTNIYNSIYDFVHITKSLKLTLSTKGVIVAKIQKHAYALAKKLAEHGIVYQVKSNTRDLGVGFGFGGPPVKRTILKKRLSTAKGPLRRIKQLAAISRKARVLFSGAGFAQSTWGFQLAGHSAADWRVIEVAAADAAGFGKGRCRLSALTIAYGVTGHPFVRSIKELFVLWFKLLSLLIKEGRALFLYKLSVAWKCALEAHADHNDFNKDLNFVTGLISHLIVYLKALNWKPQNYNQWIDTGGNIWFVDVVDYNPCSLSALMFSLVEDFYTSQLLTMANHYSSGSIKTKVLWNLTLQKNNSLKKAKRFIDLAVLETIQAGAMWPTHRCNEVMQLGECCPLCGQADPDIWHAFWTCPSLCDSVEEAVIHTQDLINDLELDKLHYYNRLLITEDLVQLGDQYAPLEHSPVFTSTVHPEGIPDNWPSGYYFGDGSGGVYSSYDFLRRCGVGIHYVNPELVPGFNAWQPLLGQVQSVPRSELTALCLVIEKVESGGTVDFFTDSKITKDTFNKGIARARFAANSDLWIQLF